MVTTVIRSTQATGKLYTPSGGLDNAAEAHNLALLLRAGALIAPIQIVEERTIGPSLGQQNIDNGVKAMLYGMLAVVLFMLVYYRKFGIVANAALLFNIVMIVGVMAMIPGATLTLPGIAGIVLTVGMAVDANVLIFERMREEFSLGKSVRWSVEGGFGKAFLTIFENTYPEAHPYSWSVIGSMDVD